MTLEECPFCEIAKSNPPGETNSALVFFSSNEVIGFVDILPLISSRAHILLIPRQHYPTIDRVDEKTAADLGKALAKVSNEIWKLFEEKHAVGEGKDPFAFNIIQNNGTRAGQVVHHVHFHVILRSSGWQKVLQDPQVKSLTFQREFYGKLPREDLDDERLILVEKLREKLSPKSKI